MLFESPKGSESWTYYFSENDKNILHNFPYNKIPTFIYLLCAVDNLKNSEIAILRYDEFNEVADKKQFKIGTKKIFSKILYT